MVYALDQYLKLLVHLNLGAFAKIGKRYYKFGHALSVYSSVPLPAWNISASTRWTQFFISGYFSLKICRENSRFIKM
jgi:hypothetical protein